VKDSRFKYPISSILVIQEVAKMMTENKKFQRKLAAEARRYDKEKYQKMVNEHYAKHNAWFYIDN
jgi:hypothetical protein